LGVHLTLYILSAEYYFQNLTCGWQWHTDSTKHSITMIVIIILIRYCCICLRCTLQRTGPVRAKHRIAWALASDVTGTALSESFIS